jgi:hypothetical protein
MLRTRKSSLTIPALAVLAWAALAPAARAEPRDVVLRGVVTDAAGRPVPGVAVTCSGSLQASTVGSDAGRFVLTLRPGSYAELARRPMKFRIEVRGRGEKLHVVDGPERLELTLRGVTEQGVAVRAEAVSNHAPLAAELTRALADPAQNPVVVEIRFTSGKAAKPEASKPVAAAAPPSTTTSGATSAPSAAPGTTSAPPPASAPPVTPPAAPAAGAGAVANAGAPASSPAPGTRATSPQPIPARGPEPSSAVAESQQKSPSAPVALAPATKKPPKDPETALEMLKASKEHGTILVSEAFRESVRAAVRSMQRQERETALLQRSLAQQTARVRDSLEATRRAEKASLAAARRESLAVIERARKAEKQRSRSVSSLREQAARESLGRADRSRDSLAAYTRARQATLDLMQRDSLRIVQHAKDSQREAGNRDRALRASSRRDSMLAALRMRDSLRWVAHVQDSTSAAARRDSVKASRPPTPPLDPRPPIGGRPAGTTRAPAGDSCACRLEGTVEVKSDQPLPAPMRVTIEVRGMPALNDRVDLFMGSPREFAIERVPCGTRFLELYAGPERGLVVKDPEMIGPFECTGRRLIQPRIVLVPR